MRLMREYDFDDFDIRIVNPGGGLFIDKNMGSVGSGHIDLCLVIFGFAGFHLTLYRTLGKPNTEMFAKENHGSGRGIR